MVKFHRGGSATNETTPFSLLTILVKIKIKNMPNYICCKVEGHHMPASLQASFLLPDLNPIKPLKLIVELNTFK